MTWGIPKVHVDIDNYLFIKMNTRKKDAEIAKELGVSKQVLALRKMEEGVNFRITKGGRMVCNENTIERLISIAQRNNS